MKPPNKSFSPLPGLKAPVSLEFVFFFPNLFVGFKQFLSIIGMFFVGSFHEEKALAGPPVSHPRLPEIVARHLPTAAALVESTPSPGGV